MAYSKESVQRFLRRNGVIPKEVLYLNRVPRRTVITFLNGNTISTAIPVRDLTACMPEGEFAIISRGISVRVSQIISISDTGAYTMSDGCVLQGRQYNLSEHKKLRNSLKINVSEPSHALPDGLLEKCSLLDQCPLAFCLIELVFDERGHGVDFVFRYCNRAMEAVEGKSVENMVNHSFYEVFANGDKKWLVSYADVALNGTQREIHDFSPEVDKHLTIRCYQPHPGYCACILHEE